VQIDRDGYPCHPFFPTNFGGECKFNIDNDREYLPDADFYKALSANVPKELRKDALAIQREIDQLQASFFRFSVQFLHQITLCAMSL
jgi:hypothetical protein